MSTPQEREQRPEEERLAYEAIHLAARGNVAAEQYLRLIALAARMIDDLEDADRGAVDVGRLAHLLLVELPRNPFFCAHASCLVGLHDMALNAWQDATEIERTQTTPASRVWADLINEVAVVVAGLTGGYDYRRQVSIRIREALYSTIGEIGLTRQILPTGQTSAPA